MVLSCKFTVSYTKTKSTLVSRVLHLSGDFALTQLSAVGNGNPSNLEYYENMESQIHWINQRVSPDCSIRDQLNHFIWR